MSVRELDNKRGFVVDLLRAYVLGAKVYKLFGNKQNCNTLSAMAESKALRNSSSPLTISPSIPARRIPVFVSMLSLSK